MTIDDLRTALGDLDLDPRPGGGPGVVAVALPSEARGGFTVEIRRTERAFAMRAFIMRRPDRNHLEVYARLLRKNLEARDWRFAVDDDGDVYISAYVAPDLLRGDGLDGLLGGACALVDAVFEGMARTGFDIPAGMSLRPPPAPDPGPPAT